VFFPTAAGPYTFRIYGAINGEQIDERFTSGPETFGEVQEAAAGQFPERLPSAFEVADQAERGAAAADQVLIAMGLGIIGVLLGLAALVVALVARRRTA
jgi:hypothetical protein